MTELPRSRALMRLDGPGHIMPVEPVTPPDSTAWRVVHFPVMLALVAIGLLGLTAIAIQLLSLGFGFFSYVPGARYLVPLIAAAAILAAYGVFVRVIERRRTIDELGVSGWLRELAIGACAGFAVPVATFAILALLGAIRGADLQTPRLLLPFVVQFCTAICLELILRGLFFRLAERLLGSWIALTLGVALSGGALVLDGDLATAAVVATTLQAGLLYAAMFMVTRRLWAPIGLHTALNLGQIGLYDAATSSDDPRGFVVPNLRGPDWLTGGGAGTDASVPGIALTLLLIVALIVIAVRRGRIVRPIWRRGRNPVAGSAVSAG